MPRNKRSSSKSGNSFFTNQHHRIEADAVQARKKKCEEEISRVTLQLQQEKKRYEDAEKFENELNRQIESIKDAILQFETKITAEKQTNEQIQVRNI